MLRDLEATSFHTMLLIVGFLGVFFGYYNLFLKIPHLLGQRVAMTLLLETRVAGLVLLTNSVFSVTYAGKAYGWTNPISALIISITVAGTLGMLLALLRSKSIVITQG